MWLQTMLLWCSRVYKILFFASVMFWRLFSACSALFGVLYSSTKWWLQLLLLQVGTVRTYSKRIYRHCSLLCRFSRLQSESGFLRAIKLSTAIWLKLHSANHRISCLIFLCLPWSNCTMGHSFRNGHCRNALSPNQVLHGVASNCTLPREGQLQIDQKLNQTNGLLGKSLQSPKLVYPDAQFSRNWILGTLQYILLMALCTTFTLVVSSNALSVINNNVTIAHSHLHFHHLHRRLTAHRFTAIPQVLSSMPLRGASKSFHWITSTTTVPSKDTSTLVSTNSLSMNNSFVDSSSSPLASLLFSSQTQSTQSNSIHSLAPSSQPCFSPVNDSLHLSKHIHSFKAEKLIDMKHSTGGSGAANVNGSDNSTSNSSDLYNSSWNIHLIWYSVFGVMIVVGLVANLLVVGTISGNKSLHTITNCFLLNLTVSDLLTLIFNANFNLYFLLTGHWPFGRVFCVVNNFITNLTIFSSVCTIMFTSKER